MLRQSIINAEYSITFYDTVTQVTARPIVDKLNIHSTYFCTGLQCHENEMKP
jgi:hypothetical protein